MYDRCANLGVDGHLHTGRTDRKKPMERFIRWSIYEFNLKMVSQPLDKPSVGRVIGESLFFWPSKA